MTENNNKIDYNNLSQAELLSVITELTEKNNNLKNNNLSTMPDRVKKLLLSGINNIEDIAENLTISAKNVSSNLTYIRREIIKSGQTIISHRMNNKTMLAIVSLKDLNWE
jgi:predicted aldo/keto reductase-like oxidoreductase